jgi:YhcH/YjgK/YiaL family protein
MILDRLPHASLYSALNPLFAEGFAFIAAQAGYVPGRYPLSGGAYAMVQEYDSQPVGDEKFEAHRRFIDIQYIASGEEIMYYAELDQLTPGEYHAGKDYIDLDGAGLPLHLQAGEFVIFFPQDAHLSSRCTEAGPRPVRKVVIKVPVA